jgi:N-acetylglucosamine repressor
MTLRSSSANRDLMRRMNEASVFGIIHDAGPISRTEIARRSGLSLATISGITGALIERGIVREESVGESTGGRRPVLLSIDRSAAVAIGVKLTDTEVIVALTDLGAELIEQQRRPLGTDRSPEAVVASLGAVVDELRAAHPDRPIVGLGLGLAGVIDRDRGVCRFSPFLPWRDVPLRDLIEARTGLAVIVENDVNALTIAERWFGEGASTPTFLVITLGRGVGMGIMLDGKLFRGSRDGAGEIGHITMVEGGERCNCGKRGCLEAYVSESSLERDARVSSAGVTSLEEAIDRARKGDEALSDVFARAGHLLGLALSSAINILNPALVIFGGEGSRCLDLMMPAIRETLSAHCFDSFDKHVRIVVEPWGDDLWARGAAALALDDYFHPTAPRIHLTTPTG